MEHHELCTRAATELEVTRPCEMTTDHEVAHLAYLAAHGPEMPLNYNEAIQSPYAEQWQAMEEEFNFILSLYYQVHSV